MRFEHLSLLKAYNEQINTILIIKIWSSLSPQPGGLWQISLHSTEARRLDPVRPAKSLLSLFFHFVHVSVCRVVRLYLSSNEIWWNIPKFAGMNIIRFLKSVCVMSFIISAFHDLLHAHNSRKINRLLLVMVRMFYAHKWCSCPDRNEMWKLPVVRRSEDNLKLQHSQTLAFSSTRQMAG